MILVMLRTCSVTSLLAESNSYGHELLNTQSASAYENQFIPDGEYVYKFVRVADTSLLLVLFLRRELSTSNSTMRYCGALAAP
eukprot:6373546-Heterocapsa_arctica.AAC.1